MLDPTKSQRAKEPFGNPHRLNFWDTDQMERVSGEANRKYTTQLSSSLYSLFPLFSYLAVRMIFPKHLSNLVLAHPDVLLRILGAKTDF